MWNLAKNVFSKIIVKIICCIGIVLAGIVYFSPASVACRMVFPSQVYMISTTVYVTGSVLWSYIKQKSFIKLLIIYSVIIIFLGTVHDVLAISFDSIFLKDVSLTPYSFVLFVFLQLIIVAKQYEYSKEEIASLSKTLEETNKSYYRFVPREFLALLSKKNIVDVNLGESVSRDVTLLSADIRNFTGMSEKLDGKKIFDLLNRYLMHIAPIIRKNDGFIEKYLGDGIIAFFPNYGRKAVSCAVEMQKEIAVLQKEFIADGLPKIEIGIGLHFGKIILGTVGEKDRMNEVTLSKAIETVTILESLTKKYKKPIIVSKTVVEKWNIQGAFSITELDSKFAKEEKITEPIYSIDF